MKKINLIFALGVCLLSTSCSKESKEVDLEGAPMFYLNDKKPFVGAMVHSFNEEGSDLQTKCSRIDSEHVTCVSYLVAFPTITFTHNVDDNYLLDNSKEYTLTIDYPRDDVYGIRLSYAALDEFDFNNISFGKYKQSDLSAIFGQLTEYRLVNLVVNKTFSLDSLKLTSKYIGIQLSFESRTYGMGLYGFLIKNT